MLSKSKNLGRLCNAEVSVDSLLEIVQQQGGQQEVSQVVGGEDHLIAVCCGAALRSHHAGIVDEAVQGEAQLVEGLHEGSHGAHGAQVQRDEAHLPLRALGVLEDALSRCHGSVLRAAGQYHCSSHAHNLLRSAEPKS
jgi:hypothetical protein